MIKSDIGYKEKEAQSKYAPFFKEEIAAIQGHVKNHLSPLPWGTIPDIDQMSLLEKEGDMPQETGFSISEDGSIAVAVKTLMPNTTPQMWDW